jgi:hypothetical protein
MFHPFVGNTQCIRAQHVGNINNAQRTAVNTCFHFKIFLTDVCQYTVFAAFLFDLLCITIVGIVSSLLGQTALWLMNHMVSIELLGGPPTAGALVKDVCRARYCPVTDHVDLPS